MYPAPVAAPRYPVFVRKRKLPADPTRSDLRLTLGREYGADRRANRHLPSAASQSRHLLHPINTGTMRLFRWLPTGQFNFIATGRR
jgi:hypothetical protein